MSRRRISPPHLTLAPKRTCGRGLGAIPSGRNESPVSGRDPRCVVTRAAPAEHGFRVYPPCMSVFLRYGPAAGVSERFRPGGTTAQTLAETRDVSRRESLRPNVDSERPRVDCRLPCRDARWARPDPSSGVRGPCRTSTSRQVTRACRPRVEPQTRVGDVLRGNGRAPPAETR